MNINKKIFDILKEIGVPMHLKGYRFLKTAIEEAFKDVDILDSISKKLYPMVAKKHNATSNQVERAIRHSIEVACNQSDENILIYYFGNTIKTQKAMPTNSQFIATVVEHIYLSQEENA